MKIHQVRMTGFGPFRHTQSVDFDTFDDHGIFLISGRTGAGKSSILDAIVYALYDSAPRYGRGGGKHVRSDHCTPDEPTSVELVFSTADGTYRIIRSPEYLRPAKRGGGLTPEKASVELARRDGDEWTGVATARVVGEELHRILPLDRNQFLQVVLLAQGQFQQFLVASSEERQKLLRTLFRSERFTRYDEVLRQRAGVLAKELREAESGTRSVVAELAAHAQQDVPEEPTDEWITGLLDAHDTDVAVAKVDLDQAEKELLSAHEALVAATDLASRQQRWAEATATMERLSAEREPVEADRQRCERGVAAGSVALSFGAVRTAARAVENAGNVLSVARDRYVETAGESPPADLPVQRDRLTSERAVLATHLVQEQELERLRMEARAHREQHAGLIEQLTRLADECARHEQVRDAESVTTAEQAERALAALRDELERSRRREAAEVDLRRAFEEQVRCGRDRTEASAALDRLRERQFAEYAGTLAGELRDGHECAVCGSVEHPAPARPVADAVTEAMLESALASLADADECDRAAGHRVVELRTTVESLADARSVAAVTELVEAAERDFTEARAVEQARDRAAAACERIADEQKDLELRRAKLEQACHEVGERVASLTRTVEEARGQAGSVAERIEVVDRHLAAISGLIEARIAADGAERQLADQRERFAEALDHHGFADEQSFLTARVEPDELESLRARVTAHDAEFAVARAVLSAPELQDLPADAVDLTVPRTAHTEADTVCKAAVRVHESAQGRAGTSHQLAATIRRGRAATAQARAAYEVLSRLACSLHGESPNTQRMRLENYVLGAELEQIVTAANVRLHEMSSGRYRLQRSDRVATSGNTAGLEVEVLDEYTGRTRAPQSLSGGEKFFASLALALGLAEVVTARAGGITLDTLFIDEGFGSLDAETLDIAMHTLDGLRENGRTIGLISHVETMKERIGAQLVVHQDPAGHSSVHVRA